MSNNIFKNVGDRPGLTIWRITDSNFRKINENEHGFFYTGDSYLILHTSNGRNGLKWNIHYWLGDKCNKKEIMTVALKSAELDEYLGGDPAQFKEVQNYESSLFESYFPNGIRYLNGKYTNSDNRVDSLTESKKLFMVKGKNNVKMVEVPFNSKSLNKSDVFIIEDGNDIIVWNPPYASKNEKSKAIKYADTIRNNSRNRQIIHIIDEEWDSNPRFWNYFNCTAKQISDKSNMSDEQFEPLMNKENLRLFKVSDALRGTPVAVYVEKAPLKKRMLDTKDCFIVDCDICGIYIWIGKKSTKQEKLASIQAANELAASNKYPAFIPCIRVIEGSETVAFKELFIDW